MNDPLLRCHDDFTSHTGKTCDDYISHSFCTADGEYGSAWDDGHTFADFKNEETGYDASSCTVCGCKDAGIEFRLRINGLITNNSTVT